MSKPEVDGVKHTTLFKTGSVRQYSYETAFFDEAVCEEACNQKDECAGFRHTMINHC